VQIDRLHERVRTRAGNGVSFPQGFSTHSGTNHCEAQRRIFWSRVSTPRRCSRTA
jgi:hypothetical protein